MTREGFSCTKLDCTFGLTGICLEANAEPTKSCPNVKAEGPPSSSPPAAAATPAPTSNQGPEPARRFHHCQELGLGDISGLMRGRYVRLVGVLGQTEAGKTSLLVSLYFQLTGRNLLPAFRFVSSDTLLGFEQRARLLRDWQLDGLPEQIVDHTSLRHSRSPAFLHLAMRDANGTRHDLVLPDLPGEWTSKLLSDESTADRFGFLLRSDAVLVVVEATRFSDPRKRNNAIADAKHIIVRLAGKIGLPKSIPLVLAVTKCDETEGQLPDGLGDVVKEAEALGYSIQVIPLAVFPAPMSPVRTGFGIDILLSHLVAPCDTAANWRPADMGADGRSYFRAGGRNE